MNPTTDTHSDEAFALQIMQGAKTIQPDAEFAATLEQKLNAVAQTPRPIRRISRVGRVLGSIAAVLILVAVGVFYVPPLKAIATEIIGFLKRSTSDQRSFILDIRTPMPDQTFQSVQEAEAALGHDFVEPRTLPSIQTKEEEASVQVESISFNHGSLLITYQPLARAILLDDKGGVKGYRSLVINRNMMFMWFSQVPSEIYDAAAESDEVGLVGKSAHIETISFTFKGHPVTGQFLRGIWTGGFVSQAELDAMNNGEDVLHEAVWVDDGTMQLTWKDENIVYTLQIFQQDIFDLTLEDAIQIVESME